LGRGVLGCHSTFHFCSGKRILRLRYRYSSFAHMRFCLRTLVVVAFLMDRRSCQNSAFFFCFCCLTSDGCVPFIRCSNSLRILLCFDKFSVFFVSGRHCWILTFRYLLVHLSLLFCPVPFSTLVSAVCFHPFFGTLFCRSTGAPKFGRIPFRARVFSFSRWTD